MSNRFDDHITVVATGSTIATTGTSASVTIPNTVSGQVPKFVRISATNACYVKIGTTAATATANDMLIQPADAVVLHIPSGYTKIAAIQDSAAGKCNVVALENC